MGNETITLCSFGGDSHHLPGHSEPSCVAAFVEGVDLLRLGLQASKDGVPVLYAHPDLSAATDGQGLIGESTWAQLQALDAGYSFRRGRDYPWRKWEIPSSSGPRPKRHHRLARFDSLVEVLKDEVVYALQFSGADPEKASWEELVVKCLAQLDRVGAKAILCAGQVTELQRLDSISGGRYWLGLIVDQNGGLPDHWASPADYLFCPWEILETADREAVESLAGASRLVVRVGPEVTAETILRVKEVAWGIESTSTLGLAPLVRGQRILFEDRFGGQRIDRDHWVAGVSSGYTNLHRAALRGIDDRGRCEVKVYQDEALIIEVEPGYQYASGAAVTRFSVGGDFSVEAECRYDNPQRATELVMCAINNTVYPIYHREGTIAHMTVDDEHPAFDAHGLCPYVSVEREEADGTRIMHNDSMSEMFNLRPTNFYRHDVGAGDSNEVVLRMARRGRFFTGHYKDEKNHEWIGLGYVENSSMNSHVYLRISGKHYPKSGAPDPLPANRFTVKRFCIRQPRA